MEVVCEIAQKKRVSLQAEVFSIIWDRFSNSTLNK